MWKAIQPIVAPVLLLGLQSLAVKMKWLESEMIIGFLIGFGCFWLMWAFLSNRALLAKCPWLVDWMPFLGAAEKAFASPEQLGGTYFKNRRIRLVDLAYHGLVKDKIFEDCDIEGPAILLTNGTRFTGSFFADPGDAVLVERPPSKQRIAGMVRMQGCTVKNCQLIGIGVLVTKAERQHYLAQFDAGEPINSPDPVFGQSKNWQPDHDDSDHHPQ